MADVFEEYHKLRDAYESDGWKLLRSPHSRATVALLNACFPDRSKPVGCDVLHARVQAMLESMREKGLGAEAPAGDGRTVCSEHWMGDMRLVEKFALDDGTTQYRLRSSTIAALDAVRRMGTRDIVISSPRMELIVEQINKLAALVSNDADEKRRILVERRDAAQRALDEFDENGGAKEASPDEVEARLMSVVDLLDQVPQDMRQIEEELKLEQEELVKEFRRDERPHGEIIKYYLDKSEILFNGTDGGKLYNGALEMFSNDGFDAKMHRAVRRIASTWLLTNSSIRERYDIRKAWDTVSEGMSGISVMRAGCSRAIANAVGSYDMARYRMMTKTLKELESRMWERATLRRGAEKAPSLMPDMLPPTKINALQRKLRGPANHVPPPPLEQGPQRETKVDIRELRRYGGPLTKDVVHAFEKALAPGEEALAAQLFAGLPAELRREVEVLGLISYAFKHGLAMGKESEDAYDCVSLDGQHRTWCAPRITVIKEQVDGIEEGNGNA